MIFLPSNDKTEIYVKKKTGENLLLAHHLSVKIPIPSFCTCRVSIISKTEDKYTIHDLDRGDVDHVPVESTKFLPSTTSHPTFYHKHDEVKSILQKCDISRIPPLATPCALPSKERDETASICDGKEGEFVSFDVIGTDQINDMQVNVIKVLVMQ